MLANDKVPLRTLARRAVAIGQAVAIRSEKCWPKGRAGQGPKGQEPKVHLSASLLREVLSVAGPRSNLSPSRDDTGKETCRASYCIRSGSELNFTALYGTWHIESDTHKDMPMCHLPRFERVPKALSPQ